MLPDIFDQKSENENERILSPKSILKEISAGELQRLHDIKPEDDRLLVIEKENQNKFLEEETKSIDKIIGSIAGQPVLEQQLRHLAQHLGFDANSVPDRKTLDTLRRFLGSKLLSLSTNGINFKCIFFNS